MTKFRPCIDLHQGAVKQIVGGTLTASGESCTTNFVSSQKPAYFAELYRKHDLTGAHVIKLGPNNDVAAKEALKAWPEGLQVGGGVNLDNCTEWLKAGASHVIVTSWLFVDDEFSFERLKELSEKIGKERLVVDLSCRKSKEGGWFVATNKWQTITKTQITKENLDLICQYCAEFLIHAADVEGLCKGIDRELVEVLGKWVSIPCTYAGGANNISDLQLVSDLTEGKVDLTFGSALDIFGGKTVKFDDCVAWNAKVKKNMKEKKEELVEPTTKRAKIE
eukprot:Lithocolla_globosa_v1_NODE_2392_length_2024_cov_169.287963.p1 type:complete len:278 gc:universal NODE_2392_length_2024_cov_169.287963:618-1451(+)